MKFPIINSMLISSFLLFSCSVQKTKLEAIEKPIAISNGIVKSTNSISTISSSKISEPKLNTIADSTFVNLSNYSADFVYDMRYATSDNFLKSKVYDCPVCYLRLKTVKALIEANQKFIKKGYRIKIFDCYRPLDIQKKMWAIVSNPEYVANPKKGSIHNRGGAVDITLVDASGKELDMGTTFDFFGIEASHDYENLSDEIKANRKLLKNTMTKCDFRILESEWWHYNLKNSKKDNLSNFKWNCE